jgi:hypothetical protein
MAIVTDQDMRSGAGMLSGGSTTRSTLGYDATTTPVERFLLFVTVIVLPLESHVRIVPGVSTLFFLFAVLAAYVALFRSRCVDRIWMHPVFLAAYVFTGICVALESVSPLSEYGKVVSFVLMIGGAVLVASLCRDRAALKVCLYAHIGAALWLGAVMFLTSYGTLSGLAANDFGQASNARWAAFKDAPIQGNLNAFALHCVQGGIVALAFTLTSVGIRNRNFFAGIGIFCLVASSLPMSRGAIVNAAVSCAVMVKAYGIKEGRTWLLAGLVAMSAVLLVPGAIWSRMEVMTKEGHMESRMSFYEAAMQHVDDYWFTGVGAGNFFQMWGFNHGFAHFTDNTYVVYGVHNGFLQVMIYWGLIGLVAFVAVIWKASRCLPRTCGKDALELGMLGLAISLLMVLPFGHDFSYKGFSFGLGMLVAYQRWIGPNALARHANR